jgi:O-acetylserine/cysteine efflux transporter
MRPLDFAAAIAVAFLWGSHFVVLKGGAFTEFPPFLFMALRFALVGLVMLPFVKRPRRDELGPIVVLSLILGFGHFGLIAFSIDGLDAAVAIILTNTHTAFSAALAWLVYRERLGLARAAGMLLAFCGVLLIAGAPGAQHALWPILAALGASIAWTLANFHVKRHPGLDGSMLNAWTAILAVPQLALASVLFERGEWGRLEAVEIGGIATLLYSALLVFIVGYGLWFWLLRRQPVNRAVPFTLLVPVFGIGLSAALLHETLTLAFIAGAAATMLGVALIVLLPEPAPLPGTTEGTKV